MKGEYVDSKNGNKFSKLHHPYSHNFKNTSTLSTGGDGGGGGGVTSASADGDSIEVVRRPRGRPPGSKNKPKKPVLDAREVNNPTMSPYIFEIPGGNDVVEAISGFCRRKNIGICVLNGIGRISNVTLRQLSSTPGAIITFHGRFDILSLSATVLPQISSYNVPNTFSISLAGPEGQVVGGFVVGSLVAADTVFIFAATFNNPSYHQLAAGRGGGGEGVEETRNTLSSGGDGEGGHSPPFSGGCGDSTDHGGGGSESCGVSMYSCHYGGGSDGVWAPTVRPPPPPPPY